MSEENLYPYIWEINKNSASLYVSNVVEVLADYAWIYKTKDVNIFVDNMLECIPNEWTDDISSLTFDELKKLPFGFFKESWSVSLKKFLQQCMQLAEVRFTRPNNSSKVSGEAPSSTFKSIPMKKQKEIVHSSSFMFSVYKTAQCNSILDIGCGVGHLDYLLHSRFGVKCIGIDASEKLTAAATAKQNSTCCDSSSFETLHVENTNECIEKLSSILRNGYNSGSKCHCGVQSKKYEDQDISSCMVGLHCCGNLTQNMMKLFCRMKEIKALVVIGCCYHKAKNEEFPMSQIAQKAVKIKSASSNWYPTIQGLRLGAHATKTVEYLTEKNLLHSEKSLIYRGLIEYYIRNENINWKMPKRRIRSTDFSDFSSYCNIAFSCYKFQSEKEREEHMTKLQKIYADHEFLFPRIKVMLILQMMLQPLWECFVIFDRFLYFKENAIQCDIYTVWDISISCRNIALCAIKE